jgi:hypothetical protein
MNKSITHLRVSERSQRELSRAREDVQSGRISHERYNEKRDWYYRLYLRLLGKQREGQR